MNKGQRVGIKVGSHHNPTTPYREPEEIYGTFIRMSAADEFAIVAVPDAPWPFTHIHVRVEDLTTV